MNNVKKENMLDVKLNLKDIVNMSDSFDKYDLLNSAININEEEDYNLTMQELKNIIDTMELEYQLYDLGFEEYEYYTFKLNVNGYYIEYNTFYNTLYIRNVDEVITKDINTIKEYVNYYKSL